MPRFLYTCLIALVLPLLPLKLIWRSIKQPEYLAHWRERFGFYTEHPTKNVIWLHCVSVGETRAAEPLIKTLMQTYPQHQILITHSTPTGRATSEQLFKDQVLRAYLPIDLPFAVNRFLSQYKPVLGVLMETELWFNLIAIAHHKHIPMVLLSGRMSEKSAQGYRKLGTLTSKGLQQLAWVAAQTSADEARFVSLGARNTLVCGNLKFDVVAPENSMALGQQLRQHLGAQRTVFMAASTREGEEELILEAVKDLPILTLLVPRHPQRFDEVEVLLTTRGLRHVLRDEITGPIPEDTQVVLGNTMGEMYTYYAASDFAFIGGSLLKFGGQNLIEAASMGKPIIFGRYMYNFAEAAKLAVVNGAASQVKDLDELRQKVNVLYNQPEKREQMRACALEFSKASTGATAKVLKEIAVLLPQIKPNTAILD